MPYLPSHRDLLVGFRSGDRAALRAVFAHYAPDVARRLRAGLVIEGAQPVRTRGPIEEADLLQEIFARAFTPATRAAYDGVGPYAAFLMGIARNVVLDGLRRTDVGTRALSRLTQVPADAQATPEELVGQAEVDDLMSSFLCHLSPADRLLCERRFVEGLSQETVAGMAGVSRIQIRRSEAKLRRRLIAFALRHGLASPEERLLPPGPAAAKEER